MAHKIRITYNKQNIDANNTYPELASHVALLSEAIGKLDKNYIKLMELLDIPVDIADNMGNTLGTGGYDFPRVSKRMFEEKMDPFTILREEVTHTLEARLGHYEERFTDRPQWIDGVRQDAHELRAKVVLQLQRVCDKMNKRSPTGEYYTKHVYSTTTEMLPEVVAAEAMFERGYLKNAIFQHMGHRFERDAALYAKQMGMENDEFEKSQIEDALLKEYVYSYVTLFVLGLDDEMEKIEKSTSDPYEQRAKIGALFKKTRLKQGEQIEEALDLIDYYLDENHDKKPAELMKEAFPHLYPQTLQFKKEVAAKIQKVEKLKDSEAYSEILDIYRLDVDEEAIDAIRAELKRGTLTLEGLEKLVGNLPAPDPQNRPQVAMHKMLTATLELHKRAAVPDGKMLADQIAMAELDAKVDGKTAMQKATAPTVENYVLAGAIRDVLKKRQTDPTLPSPA